MHMNSFYIHIGFKHGCQNPDLDPTILRFYDPTCQKLSGFFKDFCDHSGLVKSYNSDDPNDPNLL